MRRESLIAEGSRHLALGDTRYGSVFRPVNSASRRVALSSAAALPSAGKSTTTRERLTRQSSVTQRTQSGACMMTRRQTAASKSHRKRQRMRIAGDELDLDCGLGARARATSSISSEASTPMTIGSGAGEGDCGPAGAGANVQDAATRRAGASASSSNCSWVSSRYARSAPLNRARRILRPRAIRVVGVAVMIPGGMPGHARPPATSASRLAREHRHGSARVFAR